MNVVHDDKQALASDVKFRRSEANYVLDLPVGVAASVADCQAAAAHFLIIGLDEGRALDLIVPRGGASAVLETVDVAG